MVKVVTINILFELEDWEQRRQLLVQGLAAEQPDLIALQEVRLPEDTSIWLAEQLNMPYRYVVPRQQLGKHGIADGIAILSRHPFQRQEMLALQSQGRVVQFVQVDIQGQPWGFCNGHYYWYPGSHPDRDQQVQQMLAWLEQMSLSCPVVAVGDFNGTPETSAILLMRQSFTSAYAACHGQEPEFTCPTPLKKRKRLKYLRHIVLNLIVHRTLQPWRGTLDYIFVNSQVQVRDCRVILNQPAPHSRTLYPSDHFGLVADLDQVL